MMNKKHFNNIPNPTIKDENGKTHFLSRSICTLGVWIFEKGSIDYVLIGKRKKHLNESGRYCVPGGYLDFNESITDCVIRETYEETGLFLPLLEVGYVKAKLISGSINDFYFYNDQYKVGLENITFRYFAKFKVNKFPKVCDTDENEAVKFYPVKDIYKLDFAFGQDKIIKHALNFDNDKQFNKYERKTTRER